MRKKVQISCRNNYLAKERLSPLIAGFSKTETIVNQSIYKKIPLTSQGPAGKQGIDGEMGQMGEKVLPHSMRILCVGLMDVSPSTYYYILKSEGKADRTAKVYKFI